MSEHRWNWTTRTELPSQAGAHIALVQGILERLAQLGWDGRDFFGVEMALEESLTNAIRHGNRFDDAKKVRVECKLSSDRFWIQVRDEGPGFTPSKVPDCTDDDHLGCPGGRGLALIQAFMTRVEHNDTGNCVTMEKIRTTSGESNGGPA